MLSYRHSFHAGNFADVLKHTVLVEILESLVKKDKPFEYIDTHSGAGLYNLASDNARKLNEHDNGIGKLWSEKLTELKPYLKVVKAFNDSVLPKYYPGSPLIALQYLRPQDKAWLYELHPQDMTLLERNIRDSRQAKAHCSDGYQGLLSRMPPVSRRGLVLIDPSYEVKSEYEQVFAVVEKAYKKFSTGVFAIWYPVVDRSRIDKLEKRFRNSGIKDIQRYELGLSADSEERGMTSSGMIVINPPWGLLDRMSKLLPQLVKRLSESDEAFYKCEILVRE